MRAAGESGKPSGNAFKPRQGKPRAPRDRAANHRARRGIEHSPVATEDLPDIAHEAVPVSVAQIAAQTRQTAEAQHPVSAPLPAAESTLRVDVELLNRMMNLVGELVLTRNQILQASQTGVGTGVRAYVTDDAMTNLARRLDMVTADLREAVMKARMQPVSHIFSKMPRLVRDLAQTLGRRVKLQLEGQETELDKGLLEAIKDPLTHAVRNAMDHGIEPPEARAVAGKHPEGTLTLRAAHEGSHVIVEVSDDGAGISPERIRTRAVDRGLVDAARAAALSERELLQMVFLPGFSTAAAVTSVSGRGVGMDVVRANIEKIGGTVELDARPGEGTTLRMRIPLTLAIVPALIVESCEQSFALPQAAIQELVQISASESGCGTGSNSGSDSASGVDPVGRVEWIGNAPFYRLRGHLLPLVFLDRVLEPAGSRRPDPQRRLFVAVLEADGRRYGLAVDGLADPEEVVIKPLGAAVKEIGLFSAATVRGNGELALILDPGAIAARAGVGPREGDINKLSQPDNTHGAVAPANVQMEYMLAEAAGRRVVVPLESVERIERVRLGQIEYAAARPVLFERGHLLPIDDSFGALAAAGQDPDAALVIVVCRHGARQSGIAVSRVVTVAAGEPLIDAASGCVVAGVTLIEGCVIDIFEIEDSGTGSADALAHWTAA